MDEYEYLDQFFYSPTWSDIDLKQRSSDFRSEFDQPNGLLLGSDRINEDDNSNSRTSMINSNGSTESLAAQDASSVVVGSESDYGVSMALHSAEAQLQEEMVNGDNSVEVTNLSAGSSLLPFPGEVGHMQCNAFEPPEFQSLRSDFQTLSQIPHLSPLPSFEGVSSLSPGLGQDTKGGFGFRGGEYIDNDLYAVESHSSNLSASLSSMDTFGLPNYPLSSFASGPQTMRTSVGLQSLSQITSTTPPGESNGTGKPRVRARRGQATDPHSIAERLRREKIADRMKSLQELLPNTNKTDKASMLDEIIEYVKFLQLQVKVLSTSALGEADAIEGGDGADTVFSSDEIAFEQELVKLLESNVTKAMQYLQTKNICLMPVALASAMSTGKEKEPSFSALPSYDGKENGIHPMPSNGNANTSPTAGELKPKI